MMSSIAARITTLILWSLFLGGAIITGCSDRPAPPPTPDIALFDAVKALDPQAVKSLLDQGASVQARDEGGNTPLHVAAASAVATLERVELARQISVILLERGADASATNSKGYTPADMARALGVPDLADAIEQRDG